MGFLLGLLIVAFALVGVMLLLAKAAYFAATWLLVVVTVAALAWLRWMRPDRTQMGGRRYNETTERWYGLVKYVLFMLAIMWTIGLAGRYPGELARLGGLFVRGVSR